MTNVARELVESGMSKYKIAKSVGVSWNTVHFWVLGIFKPKNKYQTKLEALKNDITASNL